MGYVFQNIALIMANFARVMDPYFGFSEARVYRIAYERCPHRTLHSHELFEFVAGARGCKEVPRSPEEF